MDDQPSRARPGLASPGAAYCDLKVMYDAVARDEWTILNCPVIFAK